MKEPFFKLLKCIHIDLAKGTIMSIDLSIFHILKIFTAHEDLGSIFMEYNKPKNPDLGIDYANTILGALLCISILPKTMNGPYDHFQNIMDQVRSHVTYLKKFTFNILQTSVSATENILYTNTAKVTEYIYTLVLSLLKCSTKVRGEVLYWLGGCLKANADRGKLWNAQMPEFNPANYTNVSDGFMINLGSVLMYLCQPFCSPENHLKLLKVDPTYCAVKNEDCSQKGIHMADMYKETCLLPACNDDGEEIVRPTAASYNFVTECFYMGHRTLDLGFRVTVDKLVRLNQVSSLFVFIYSYC